MLLQQQRQVKKLLKTSLASKLVQGSERRKNKCGRSIKDQISYSIIRLMRCVISFLLLLFYSVQHCVN
jgi:hypothetical protein